MRLLFKGARLLDPTQGLDAVMDLLVEDGRIREIGSGLDTAGAGIVAAEGLWLTPGLVDPHVHFRDPGETWKEDLDSGRRAAAAGGYTAVAVMPNTVPAVDGPALVGYIVGRTRGPGTRVYPIGAITKGRRGEELAEFGLMRDAGAVAVSDDGRGVASARIMRLALLYARAFDLPVIAHEEDEEISQGGVMNLGETSTRLGLPGSPREAEEVMVARDLILAEENGGRLHLAHLSSRRSVSLLREAKARGLAVTAEVTPHHLLLTEAALAGYDPNAKVNPPLRTEEDRRELIRGLVDGTLNAVASDHAPHTALDKEGGLAEAAPGLVGLETTLGLVLTELVRPGIISPLRAVEVLSTAPARILGVPGGTLRPGSQADLTLIDPESRWTVDPEKFYSKSRNTPFAGRRLIGRAVGVWVDGERIYPFSQGGF